jgi:hypothetical protein
MVATTSTINGTASTTNLILSTVSASPAVVNGDSGSALAVQPGTSRTIMLEGILNGNGSTGFMVAQVTRIYYGNSASALQGFNINFGIESLRATTVL